MAEDNLSRRVLRLRARPTLSEKSDEYLAQMLTDAMDFFLDYTHRGFDPGAMVDGLICDLAVYRINQEGVEDVQSATIGDISTTWYPTLPPSFIPRLNGYRLVVGLNAERRA